MLGPIGSDDRRCFVAEGDPKPNGAGIGTWSVRVSAPGAAASTPVPGFITADPRTLAMLERARHYARSHLPVLIEGESGTGKELLADGVHRLSGRPPSAWVAVNCGALPSGLQEAELFGARRGAYTGATADRVGLIEEANGGTLFLDEVGEMSLATQAKLLRFLEQGEIRRLGENRVRTVEVRVVAATNRDLGRAVDAGHFRKDLFYRLCGAMLRVASLPERSGDIPLLSQYFLSRFERRYDLRVSVEPELTAELARLSWPGNVRQLRNEIERAAVLAAAESRPISIDDFHREHAPAQETSFAARVAEFERRLILEALERTGWNRTRAAQLLGGVKRTTLIGKMRRLGIEEPGGHWQADR
jgi:transcriptional regulator with PAS, ATPase and Fis domain